MPGRGGGFGGPPDPRSIRIYRPGGALVITRPVLVHYRIEKLLTDLRKARADGF